MQKELLEIVDKIISGSETDYSDKVYELMKDDVYKLVKPIIQDTNETNAFVKRVCRNIYYDISTLEDTDMFKEWVERYTTVETYQELCRTQGKMFHSSTKARAHYRYKAFEDDIEWAQCIHKNRKSNKRYLSRLYKKLSPRKVVLFQMFCLEDCSIDEICDMLKINEKVLKVKLVEIRETVLGLGDLSNVESDEENKDAIEENNLEKNSADNSADVTLDIKSASEEKNSDGVPSVDAQIAAISAAIEEKKAEEKTEEVKDNSDNNVEEKAEEISEEKALTNEIKQAIADKTSYVDKLKDSDDVKKQSDNAGSYHHSEKHRGERHHSSKKVSRRETIISYVFLGIFILIGLSSAGYKAYKTSLPVTVYNGVDYSAVYDYKFYLEYNPDVAEQYGDDDEAALEHFVYRGMKEGRIAKSTFILQVYKENNPDLVEMFGDNNKAYYEHFITNGQGEHRVSYF